MSTIYTLLYLDTPAEFQWISGSFVADEGEPWGGVVPTGKDKDALYARTQLVKSYYRKWINDNPEKRVWNQSLSAYIYVKGQSINETMAKAALTVESTQAIARLTEVLSQAIVISESEPKPNRNQHIYEKILIMQTPDNVRLIVGLQRSCKEFVQYSIKTGK